MKKITLIVLMLATAFGGFAKTKKKKVKKKVKSEITSVSIHRTVCFGRCPDYTVQIDKDGTATYTAIRFTEDTGIFRKNIGKAKATEIINEWTRNRVDTCQDQYENRIPDLPGLTITVKYTNKTKTIYSANFGPEFLQRIATMMDEVGIKAKTDRSWKKIGMPKAKK